MRRDCFFLAGLLVLTFACLWPVGSLGFIGYDDCDYVYQNPVVCSGLNFESVEWAFTGAHAGNWHPLTWLSHSLDCQLFGLNPHEEHWVNLGFHAVNTLLLFWWLRGLSTARWRGFFVAALFAVHPLHVQSVAWISERKDVLSGCCFMLTLLGYTRYCRHNSAGNYLLVVALFALGLMAKPMLVTVPIVLLLLDYWPLRRFTIYPPAPGGGVTSELAFAIPKQLLLEKIPLFLLSLASCLVTFWAQSSGGAVISMQVTPLWGRLLHAVVAYGQYLGKMLYPVDLALFYPLSSTNPDALVVLGSLILLIILSLAGLLTRQIQPWLLVGWAWFMVMLLPVIGLVQVGLQSMADRYSYLPSIGLFIAVVWGLADLADRLPSQSFLGGTLEAGSASSRRRLRGLPSQSFWRAIMAGLGAASLLACGLDSRYQLGFWRNNLTLFQHVVDVSPKNDYMGYFYLGISYAELGQLDSAARSLTSALHAKPDFELARSRLGNVLLLQKKYAAAEPLLNALARSHPDNFGIRVTLGMALAGQRKYGAAQSEYQAALLLNPNEPTANRLFAANAPKADAELTLNELASQMAFNVTPEIHVRIAEAMSVLGRYSEAVHQYRLALAQTPDSVVCLNNLAWLLATCPDNAVRNGSEAVPLAQHACELTQSKQTVMLGTLAAACAEAGQFDAAVRNANKACDLATVQGETELLAQNRTLLELYQHRHPYHESTEPPILGENQP